MNNSPYIRKPASVQLVMLKVLLALLPGIAAYVWFFGAGVLIHLLIASLAALAGEALMLKARGRPVGIFLADLSAVVTAWLIVLTFPPIVPWWLTVGGDAVRDRRGQAALRRAGSEPVQSGHGSLRDHDRRLPGADVAVAAAADWISPRNWN